MRNEVRSKSRARVIKVREHMIFDLETVHIFEYKNKIWEIFLGLQWESSSACYYENDRFLPCFKSIVKKRDCNNRAYYLRSSSNHVF